MTFNGNRNTPVKDPLVTVNGTNEEKNFCVVRNNLIKLNFAHSKCFSSI